MYLRTSTYKVIISQFNRKSSTRVTTSDPVVTKSYILRLVNPTNPNITNENLPGTIITNPSLERMLPAQRELPIYQPGQDNLATFTQAAMDTAEPAGPVLPVLRNRDLDAAFQTIANNVRERIPRLNFPNWDERILELRANFATPLRQQPAAAHINLNDMPPHGNSLFQDILDLVIGSDLDFLEQTLTLYGFAGATAFLVLFSNLFLGVYFFGIFRTSDNTLTMLQSFIQHIRLRRQMHQEQALDATAHEPLNIEFNFDSLRVVRPSTHIGNIRSERVPVSVRERITTMGTNILNLFSQFFRYFQGH